MIDVVTRQANESFSPKRTFRRILCGICPTGTEAPTNQHRPHEAGRWPATGNGPLPRLLAWADMRQAVGLKAQLTQGVQMPPDCRFRRILSYAPGSYTLVNQVALLA